MSDREPIPTWMYRRGRKGDLEARIFDLARPGEAGRIARGNWVDSPKKVKTDGTR